MRNIYTKLQIINLIALCTLKKKRKQEVTEKTNEKKYTFKGTKIIHIYKCNC